MKLTKLQTHYEKQHLENIKKIYFMFFSQKFASVFLKRIYLFGLGDYIEFSFVFDNCVEELNIA